MRARLGAAGRSRRVAEPSPPGAGVAGGQSGLARAESLPALRGAGQAGPGHGQAGREPNPAGGERGRAGRQSGSAREAQARSRARDRGDRQRQALRPLGLVFIAVVVTASVQTHPTPGLGGSRLAVVFTLIAYAASVATAITVGWARRGVAAQAVIAGLIGACGVALAVLQPHGPAGLAASMGVWIAAVRMPPVKAAVTAGVITTALAVAVGLTEHPAVQSAIIVTLLCLLLAVTGQFIRRGRESQDHAEMLLAQLQDAREAEAAAAAVAERGRIAGELHDVLAHALSGLAIQLQGARKLAGREVVSDSLRAAIDRSAELAREGLADARHAVGALRGDRLPNLDQLDALVTGFRRDTGAEATLRIEGNPRPLPADAGLALFRGAQEALTNITRYAAGATAAITICYQPGRTLLTVQDNGQAAARAGQDAGRPGVLAGAGGGHGLTAMAERAERAGGAARAGPTADGWQVELEVPA